MNRDTGTRQPNEGFKIYVNSIGDIYSYDDDNKVIINGDQTVTTLSEPILHAKRYAGTEITKTGMYEMSVNIPSEMAGQEFYIIFEAIQEYGNANYIDNIGATQINQRNEKYRSGYGESRRIGITRIYTFQRGNKHVECYPFRRKRRIVAFFRYSNNNRYRFQRTKNNYR